MYLVISVDMRLYFTGIALHIISSHKYNTKLYNSRKRNGIGHNEHLNNKQFNMHITECENK